MCVFLWSRKEIVQPWNTKRLENNHKSAPQESIFLKGKWSRVQYLLSRVDPMGEKNQNFVLFKTRILWSVNCARSSKNSCLGKIMEFLKDLTKGELKPKMDRLVAPRRAQNSRHCTVVSISLLLTGQWTVEMVFEHEQQLFEQTRQTNKTELDHFIRVCSSFSILLLPLLLFSWLVRVRARALDHFNDPHDHGYCRIVWK